MTWFALSPLIVLLLAATLAWALNERVRTWTIGLTALGACALALAALLIAPQYGDRIGFTWATINNRPQTLELAIDQNVQFIGTLLLLCGAATAGGIAWTLGTGTRAFGLVFAGLPVLLGGGLITIASTTPIGAIVGLGMAWLGGTIMQQATTPHVREASFGGLGLLVTATALLLAATTPQLSGQPISPELWLGGCALLIALAPRWGTTTTAPLLIRAPVTAMGLPLLGSYLLVQYASATASGWPARLTIAVLAIGVIGLVVGAINALVALRFGHAFAWQIVAQLALIVIVFGTGRPEAGPMAAGLLAHALVSGTGLALAIGQLERITRGDVFAELPPLPQPLRRAGLAYGLAAISAAGIPPLLGYALRRVVLILAGIDQPWLPPLLLAASTLLALSFLPTLAAFFRRPAFKSPIAAVDGRAGIWPLLLMIGLLLGGALPETLWQRTLGDPGAAQATIPPLAAWLVSAAPVLLGLLILALTNRALRRSGPPSAFAGGEPLDEEPGWTLPFVALRRAFAPLVVPERVVARRTARVADTSRERLTDLRQTLERRYYLAVIVASLIVVLLLATQ